MRKYRILILFNLLIFVIACEKKPVASFDTNKRVNGPGSAYSGLINTNEYASGDTVKLINNSKSGSTFQWIMPDGSIATTKDAEYVIEANTGFTELSFNLTTKSKGICKRNSITKTINVIPQSSFTWSTISLSFNKTYIPYLISSSSDASNYTILVRYFAGYPSLTFFDLRIYFPPGSPPSAGTYTLQSSASSLPPNGAFISIYGGTPDAPGYTYFTTGQIQVEYISSTMHVYFTDAQTNPVFFKLAASIYKR